MFTSEAKILGKVNLPNYTGLRIMMMPFKANDFDTLSRVQIGDWKDTIRECLKDYKLQGIGYITIDEAIVEQNTTHRRPGLHTDGGYRVAAYGGDNNYSPYGSSPAYSASQTINYASYGATPSYSSTPNNYSPYGGEPSYGSCGMIVVTNTIGAKAYLQNFDGNIGAEGDCEHLRSECKEENAVIFGNSEAWWCGPTCVHESVPMIELTKRQFLRISFPSMAPYHWPYTENITGVTPVTQPGPDRSKFMSYRK